MTDVPEHRNLLQVLAIACEDVNLEPALVNETRRIISARWATERERALYHFYMSSNR
jgi:uncharacterized DUF497 family protein